MLHHCRQGNLQAVLDEQRHLLLGSALVVRGRQPGRDRGQPRQEELVTRLDRAGVDVARLRDWAVDLSPRAPAQPRQEELVTLLDRAGVDVARLRNWRRVFRYR